ncbi:MAG: rod shape-determining protein RodA [Hyphomicrobiaceae bacterium]|nr:rod shape-determining protein RodA [Hyphomicrobiaceae bacterium]
MSSHTHVTQSGRPPSLAAKLARVDWLLLVMTGAIAVAGTATLYSVAGGSFEPWAERHALRYLVGTLLVLIMALVPPRIWLALAYPVYAVVLLALALVPLIGTEVLGARRWITIGGSLTVQPSELMKIALVVALARYYQWLPAARVSRMAWIAPPALMIVLPIVLTLRQPDLGTAALFAMLGATMMFLAGVSWLYFAAGAAGLLIAFPVAWNSLHAYQQRRIEVFLDPDKDPLGAGYHITQSKIALGSGGVEGKGFMQGSQSQLDFLPEKHTDFAFTMFGEEWGFVGAMALVVLYGAMLAKILASALKAESQYARLVTAGAGLTLFIYVFINIAMVSGLVPVVGVPLPLLSYGGSAMMSMMAVLGLAMSAGVHGRDTPRRGDLGPWW